MTDVFLIQTNGNEPDRNSPAETLAREPINHQFYNHPDWHRSQKDQDFGKVSEGDRILLYCTTNVEECPQQIKYIFQVQAISEDREDGAEEGVPNKLHLEVDRKLSPGFPKDKIRQWVDEGRLSEKMNRAGTQGFNISQVEESDYQKILDWSHDQEPEPAVETYEEDLRSFIAQNGLEVIGDEFSEYNLYQDEEGATGELYNIPVGEIDLLYRNEGTEDFLVLELKRTESTPDKVVGQIARYMGWVQEELAEETESRGLIITKTPSQQLEYAVKAIPDCRLFTYRLNFEIQEEQ